MCTGSHGTHELFVPVAQVCNDGLHSKEKARGVEWHGQHYSIWMEWQRLVCERSSESMHLVFCAVFTAVAALIAACVRAWLGLADFSSI